MTRLPSNGSNGYCYSEAESPSVVPSGGSTTSTSNSNNSNSSDGRSHHIGPSSDAVASRAHDGDGDGDVNDGSNGNGKVGLCWSNHEADLIPDFTNSNVCWCAVLFPSGCGTRFSRFVFQDL